MLCLAVQPVKAQITSLDDAVDFTQRAPAVSDARSLGMAGAGRGGRDDVTALFYNPAGLGWMRASTAGGALAFIGTEEEATFGTGLDPTSADVNDYGGHFGLAYKFPTAQGSLVIAGSYNQVNSFGRRFDFDRDEGTRSITQAFLPAGDEYDLDGGDIIWRGDFAPQVAYEGGAIEFFPFENDEGNYPFEPAALEGTTVDQAGAVTSEGRLNEVSLGAGLEAAPGVMLGLSANIAFGRYAFSNAFSEIDMTGQNDDYEVLRGGQFYRGLDEVRFEERFTSELTGVNLRGGVSAEALPGVRLGFTAESPTFYQVDEFFSSAEVTTFFDDGTQLSYGGRVEDAGTVENKYEIRTPWRLGAGLDANLLHLTAGVADLTLAADIEFVDWSQLERSSEFIDLRAGQRENGDYNAVLNTNFGLEYRVAGLALRGGFAHRPDPRAPDEGIRRDVSEDSVNSERLFYSLGAGYAFGENFRIDAGWMQERFDDEFSILPYGDVSGPAREEVTRNQFLVGATFLF